MPNHQASQTEHGSGFDPGQLAAWQAQLEDFRSLITAAPPHLRLVKPGPDAWSLQEIIGHLVDSATNNHQRLVRLQLLPELAFPGYDQEEWVKAGHYQSADWDNLAALWWQLNLQLLHLITRIPAGFLGRVWVRPEEIKNLETIVRSYFSHLQTHREQFVKRQAEANSTNPTDK